MNKDNRKMNRMSIISDISKGKNAITSYKTIEIFDKSNLSFIECRLDVLIKLVPCFFQLA